MLNFESLSVSKVVQLTRSAVAITFAIPEHLRDTFAFVSGQYITLKQTINGEEVRRAYSISSAPDAEDITVGIKMVEGGVFSTYANTALKTNTILDVMPPEGRFTFKPSGKAVNIAAFAAGSGITPILSIVKTVLSAHSENTFVLVYGNQTPEEVMFMEEINALKEQYSERFFIKHTYSRTQESDAFFGRIEASTVNYIVKNQFKEKNFDAFYLCGPETMIHLVSDTLKANGVSENAIHFELFTSANAADATTENLDGSTEIEVVLDDETFSFAMDQKQLVLDAVLAKDIDAPYSCQGGVCSSCIARVKEGEAKMVNNQILTDSEIAEGLILTCQAHATTSKLTIDYDDV